MRAREELAIAHDDGGSSKSAESLSDSVSISGITENFLETIGEKSGTTNGQERTNKELKRKSRV
ncbi:MAG: hypothetical protein MUO26_01800 [Methanotrichaceae archaeon]|nr:hypothetical protein [Methanotrichaceae archaeon]